MKRLDIVNYFNSYIINLDYNNYYINDEKNRVFVNADDSIVEIVSSSYDGYIFHFMTRDLKEFSVNFSRESYEAYPHDCLYHLEKRINDNTNDTSICEITTIHMPKKEMLKRVSKAIKNTDDVDIKSVVSNFSIETGLHKLTVRSILV